MIWCSDGAFLSRTGSLTDFIKMSLGKKHSGDW